MHRFYSQEADFNENTFSIADPDEIHHMRDVLRLSKGAEIQVFNAKNQEATVIIESLTAQEIRVSVKSIHQVKSSNQHIILACAPPKKDKFEWIIEKCTELGVDEIIPLKTKRTEVVFSAQRMPGKLLRFQKVALNAAKQCKRTKLPKIHPMMELPLALKQLPEGGLSLIPSLNNHPPHIKEVIHQNSNPGSITVFIGPEGDFTPDEVRLALDKGCKAVSLGETVLKVETAAIATISFLRLTI